MYSPYATYTTTFVGIFNGEELSHKADVRGHITSEPLGKNGYMYDKVFCPQRIETQMFADDDPVKDTDKTYAQMSIQERDQFNARREALLGLLAKAEPTLDMGYLSTGQLPLLNLTGLK